MFHCISMKLYLRRRSNYLVEFSNLGYDSELHNTNNAGDLYGELSQIKITNIEKS